MVYLAITLLMLPFLVIGAPVLAAEEGEEPPALEVLARYDVSEIGDRIMGVQWASRDSIYLGLFRRGVVEVDLREGLPEVDHLLETRPDMPSLGLPAITRFGISEDWIVASLNRFAWAPRVSGGGPAVPTLQRTRSGAFDFAVDGETVVLWGFANMEHWKEAEGGVLWEADLSEGLDSWEAIYRNEEVAADPSLLMENTVAKGSVDLLDNGDVLLAPNAARVLPPVLRISSSGKIEETWTAEELWADEAQDPADAEEVDWSAGGARDGKTFAKRLGKMRVIDAVLALPEGPAIVAREPKDGEVRWRLAVLSPEVRWYDIPVRHLSSAAQFVGDADDKGRIVMVGATRELHEKVRVKENEVLVLRVPVDQ